MWRFGIQFFIFITLLVGIGFTQDCLAEVCHESGQPKEINIFLDLNASWREVQVAQEEACKQGKLLRIIPDWPQRSSFSKLTEKHTRLELALEKCPDNSCIEAKEEQMASIVAKMDKFKAPRIERDTLEGELAAIKAQYPNTDIGRLLISGHDGGGNFNGYSGEIDRQDIYEAFDQYPELRKSVRGVYLLGCNSGTTMELSLWGSIFPNASFVNGYEGQAPLNFRDKGLEYLSSLMQKEEEIMASKSRKEIEERLLQVSRIREGYTGLRLVCSGIKDNEGRPIELNAFGLSADRGSFLRSDPTSGCHSEKFEENYRKFLNFYHGHDSIPRDTGPSSPVRSLYNFASRNAHCMDFQDEFKVPTNMAFGLNFFHAFKKNAVKASEKYKEGIVDGVKIDIEELYDEYGEYLKKMKEKKVSMKKAFGILDNLLDRGTKSFTNDQLWNIVDQMNKAWGGDLDEVPEKRLLLENLQAVLYNYGGENISRDDLLSHFKSKDSLKKLGFKEFKKKYEESIDKVNEVSMAFYNLIPDSQTKLMSKDSSKDKPLSEATRQEILEDFTIRNREFLKVRSRADALLFERLGTSADPYLSMLVQKSLKMHERSTRAFEAYQSGAVDLTCVPFSWHEELEKGDQALGSGDPCQLRQM